MSGVFSYLNITSVTPKLPVAVGELLASHFIKQKYLQKKKNP